MNHIPEWAKVIRPTDDNVVVALEREKEETRNGVVLPLAVQRRTQVDVVRAVVVASGPGYRLRNGRGPFVPNEVNPGDIVLVDRLAGQDYTLDQFKPRQNHGAEFDDIRIVRHDEIHAVIESETDNAQ